MPDLIRAVGQAVALRRGALGLGIQCPEEHSGLAA